MDIKSIFCCIWFLVIVNLSFAGPITIPEVNLQSAKKSEKNAAPKVQITPINQEKIAESPVVNLAELLKQEQSIVRLTNNSGDNSQTALSLRGFGNNAAANSLILVDGFPLTNPSLLAPNFNSVLLSDIQHIDIIQGSEGTLWGDQAVGGVVNITTKHPQKFMAESIAALGSYRKNYFSIWAEDKFKTGIYLKAFGFTTKTNNYRDHNHQQDDNIAAQAGGDYARGTLNFKLQSYGDTIYFPGGLSPEQFAQNPRLATDFNNHSRYRTQWYHIFNQHELNSHWFLETRLDYHATRGDGVMFSRFTRQDSQTHFSPRVIGHIYQNKITFGYDGQISHYQLHNAQVYSRTHAKQNSIYLQDVFPLTATLNLTLGARGAWQNNTIEKVVGIPASAVNRVVVSEQGVAYHPNNSWSFFLRRDGNYSFPKANEETWVPQNVKALNVQTGVSYEAGTEWRTAKNKAQVSVYRLALKNEIAFNPAETSLEPFGSFNNFPKTLRQGITLTENYRFTPRLSMDGQMNYVNARFAAGNYSGNVIPAVPAITGNIGFNFDFATHWQAKYAALYTGNQYASDDVTNSGKKIAAYWLNDIALQYRMKIVNVNFEILNLLNQNYATFVFYNAGAHTTTYYPGAGRNYLLTVKLSID